MSFILLHLIVLSAGLDPTPMPPAYFNSTALAALLMGLFTVTALNAPHVGRALKAYRSELWSVRRRPNVFDDQQNAPLPGAVLLALIFIVSGGTVLYNLHGIPSSPTFAGAAAAMTLLGCWYIFRRCAYWLVGYTFTGTEGRRRWLGGYSATQAFTGLALVVPALLTIYRPSWHGILLNISLSIYFIGQALFLIKGFRIFYHKIWSLLYFILYLCTLEILPILIVYRLSAILPEVA